MKPLFSRWLLLLLSSSLFYACAGKIKIPPPPAAQEKFLEASTGELVEGIEKNLSGIRRFKATCDMGFRFSGSPKLYTCKAKMLFDAPGRLYLRGYRSLLGTLFTMKTDGRNFSIYIPRKKKTFSGTEEKGLAAEQGEETPSGLERLKPANILEALMLDSPQLEDGGRRVVVGVLPDQYVLYVLRQGGDVLKPERTIRVERRHLTVLEHETFDEDGRLRGRYSFTGAIDVGGSTLPREVRMQRFWEGVEIRMAFSEVSTNVEVEDKAFAPD
jgi:outer membrane lipoprotein-sorting protein